MGEILVRRRVLTTESLISLLRDPRRNGDALPDVPRYEIGERLGEGATAIVYRAWDRDLKRPVALKVLRESSSMSQVARDRFRREAQTAGALTHPNVVQVYDVGEVSGRFYIVLELVEGQPLIGSMSGAVPRDTLLGHLEKAARGVAAAHAKGIVHRDLKPANILIGPSGEAKVGDFGLAHLSNSSHELTRTGSTLGTPLYMSPEQIRGDLKGVSPRTDVYALGAILYEMLTGRPPHTGESLPEVYDKVLNQEPMPPHQVRADVPQDLETITLKALDKDPSRRYATAAEFALDLRHAMDGEAIEARPESPARRFWRRTSRSWRLLVPALIAVVLGVGLGVAMARRSGVVLATVESLQGEVSIPGPGGRPLARVGSSILKGESVETGPAPSRAVLRLSSGVRMEIGPGSILRTDTAGSFTLASGTIVADPAGRAVSLHTPEADIRSAGGAFSMAVDQGSTRVESKSGGVRVVRLRDGRFADLEAGTWVRVLPEGGNLEPAPIVERVLRVGPGKPFALPSAAATAVTDGAVVEIDAGLYEGDVAIWNADNLTIRGVGGRARIRYSGKLAQDRAIWLLQGRNAVVENVEFSGSPEAGLWFEAPGLTLRSCAFLDNGIAISGSNDPESDLLVEHSEFARNGKRGSSNLICPVQRSATLRHCYLHHPRGGHQITSHARSTHVLYSRLTDEGSPSSMVLHALGGSTFLIGNVFCREATSPMIGPMFTLSSGDGSGEGHYFVNNTVVDGRQAESFITVGPRSTLRVTNNIFSGACPVVKGPADLANNLIGRDPLFMDPARYDFRLRTDSPAIDAGADPGAAEGFDLHPRFEYVHPAETKPRAVQGILDLGAFEYVR